MTNAITLYPYQQRWLKDESRFKIGMFARQTGKTFTTTLEIVNDCLDAESQSRRERWVILSRGERQAREAMEEGIKRHLNAYQMSFEALDYSWEGSYKALEVTLPNGSRITALPANPDTARGFSANVFLDEFAFHQDSRKIWQALFPVISRPGLKLRITSTPNGKGNKFHEIMTSSDAQWSRHQVDIYQAVADGLPRDVAQLEEAINDPDAWATEFELQWLDEASAWLPYDLIGQCETPNLVATERGWVLPSHQTTAPAYYLGWDIARRRDLSILWLVTDELKTAEIVRMRGISFEQQMGELRRLMAEYPVRRACLDQSGMGEALVELAQREHGTSRVEGVLFTGTTKQDLATVLKQRYEDRRVTVPAHRDIRDSLHAVKRLTTAAGNIRFDAERTDQGGHCYDSETELLTLDGWKKFSELSASDLIASRSVDSDAMRFEKPIAIQEQTYCGPMVRVENKQIDLMVTPNHKMFVRYRRAAQFVCVSAERLLSTKQPIEYSKAATWQGQHADRLTIAGRPVDANMFFRFMGLFISEGFTSTCNRIGITQKNIAGDEFIMECLESKNDCTDSFPL